MYILQRQKDLKKRLVSRNLYDARHVLCLARLSAAFPLFLAVLVSLNKDVMEHPTTSNYGQEKKDKRNSYYIREKKGLRESRNRVRARWLFKVVSEREKKRFSQQSMCYVWREWHRSNKEISSVESFAAAPQYRQLLLRFFCVCLILEALDADPLVRPNKNQLVYFSISFMWHKVVSSLPVCYSYSRALNKYTHNSLITLRN